LVIMKIFRIFKNSIFLTVVISLLIGLVAGTFSSLYLGPFLSEKLGLKEEKVQPDLFLEAPSPTTDKTDGNKNQQEEIPKQPKRNSETAKEHSRCG